MASANSLSSFRSARKPTQPLSNASGRSPISVANAREIAYLRGKIDDEQINQAVFHLSQMVRAEAVAMTATLVAQRGESGEAIMRQAIASTEGQIEECFEG